MQSRLGQMTVISGLLVSGTTPVCAMGAETLTAPSSLGVMLVVMGAGLVQLALYAKRRQRIHGALALFCGSALLGWTLHLGAWPVPLPIKAVLYAALVNPLLIYIQILHPRRWLRGMIDFTWAYVIPYAVIVLVYPAEQLLPILPVMEKFSFFSLATTLIAADQARRERQPGGLLLLFTLVLLFGGLLLPDFRAYALGIFTVAQVWLVSRDGRTRP